MFRLMPWAAHFLNSRRVLASVLGSLLRPSPYIGRTGVHNFPFEARSRFTLITARRFAARPKRTPAPRAPAGRSPYPTVQVATEMNRQFLGQNFDPLASCCSWHTHILWLRHLTKNCIVLLSLSKKSKRPILVILASLKINNLQATENCKMPRFRVFRQPRYISSISKRPKKVTISDLYIQFEMMHAFTW